MLPPKKSDCFGGERLLSRITPKMRQQLTGFAIAFGGMIILVGGLWLVALHGPPHDKQAK